MRMALVMALVCAVAAGSPACRSSRSGSPDQKVGGCVFETTTIGTGIGQPAETPAGAAWIRLCSVEFAGNDLYKQAARDLGRLLEARGVKIYSCTELLHVKKGPCWPPYSIEYRVDLTEQAAGFIRTFLLQNAIAGCRPTVERPEGYGTFFVSAGTGASDWWAVFYVK